MKKKNSRSGWYFLGIVLSLYIILFLFAPSYLPQSLYTSFRIAENIVPVFILVFAIMVLFEYFMTPESIKEHLSKSSGLKRWCIAVAAGILSSGPIYMWYPVLKQMKNKGVSYGFLATFLYNRAVKLPLLPIMVIYFGIEYTAILAFVMIMISLVQGFIFEKLEDAGFLI